MSIRVTSGRSGSWFLASLLLTVSAVATAADAPAPAKDTTKTPDEVLDTVVVTGSHIRKDAFTSTSPIQIISREGSVLAGLATTTDTLQGSTVTGGGQQINNYFGGYVTDGGPGANTVSLRGLGAVRTLVLLNGRRLAPSGTRGSVGSADLNVLPSSIVDHIEILKDGASSTYGSDAVAGVVNIITKKGFDGIALEGFRNSTLDGGGNQTRFSISGGGASDRGQILGSFEFYNLSNLSVGQRDWASCPTQALINPETGQYDPDSILDPVTGKPKCFPISTLGGVNAGIAHNYIVAPVCLLPDYDPCYNRWTPSPSTSGLVPGWANVDPNPLRPDFDRRQLNDSLIAPTRNYTAFLSGSYDTGILGSGELYFEALWTKRKSEQIGSRQLLLDYQVDDNFNNHPFVPSGFYAVPAGYDWGGVAINPFDNYVIARGFAFWGNDRSHQNVDYTRLVGGMRGDLAFAGDWGYDINITTNKGEGSYTFGSALTDRVYNSLYVTQVSPTFNGPKRVGFDGKTYTCQVNVSAPGTGCVPAPLLDAQFLSGNIPQDFRDYIWRDITGNTLYRESTVSAIADGGLFNLPYGKLRAAIGAEARWMSINDVPDPEMQAGNLFNFTSSGITKGSDKVREIFGELEVPVLAGVTAAENLSLNLSYRYTDYNSYGSDTTYKIGVAYAPVKWIKLRGTKGTSYRAPAIFEQYLSPTSGFLAASADPCDFYGDLPSGSVVRKNCLAEGLPLNFHQNNGVQVDSAGGAALGLNSEDSRADTAGIVIQPPFPGVVGDIAFAIDWWQIKVNGQVAQIGGQNLLNLCYEDPDFRAGGSYCTYSTRNANNELTVEDNYLNIATQKSRGLDFNVRYTRDIALGEVIADVHATRYSQQRSRLLPTDPVDEFNGEITQPKWVGDLDLQYKWKDWTVYYGLIYVGKQDSNSRYPVEPPYTAADWPYDFSTGTYLLHNISARYKKTGDWEVVVGVRNLFDKEPPTITPGAFDNRAGNSFLYSGYDYFGRRAYINVTKFF